MGDGAQQAGEGPFQHPVCHGLATGPSSCPGSTAGVLGPSPHVTLLPLSLGQDNLELELVLKGSYEDTQTWALGTASAFRFHYMAAQEAELSGRLRVGLWVSTLEIFHQLGPGLAPAAAGPSPAFPRQGQSLRLCQPPPVRHLPLADRRVARAWTGCGEGLLHYVCVSPLMAPPVMLSEKILCLCPQALHSLAPAHLCCLV